MQTVLVVDDEASIRTLVVYHLQRSGFAVEEVADGMLAYELLKAESDRFDLVILDWMLPGIDGMEVCRRLRQEKIVVPIILLTARDEEVDLVVGLEMGADDYVTKPFSPRELVARARAVLRRVETRAEEVKVTSEGTAKVLHSGDIVMNLARHEVHVNRELLELTPKEFDLLQYMMENKGHVLSRTQLLDRVWGYSWQLTQELWMCMSHIYGTKWIRIRKIRSIFVRFGGWGTSSPNPHRNDDESHSEFFVGCPSRGTNLVLEIFYGSSFLSRNFSHV